MKKTIEQEKIAYLFDNLPLSLVAVFALLSAIYIMFLSQVAVTYLNLWFAIGIVILGLRIASYLYYKQDSSLNKFKILFQHKRDFSTLTVLTAVHLGSGAFLIFPEDISFQIVLIFFIGGLATGASVTLATNKNLYKLYLLSSMAPYIGVLFVQGGEANYALVFSMSLYVIFLWINANRIFSNVTNNIELTYNNQHLIKQLEKEVKASKLANESKSKFLAVMSHELRTPLNAIIGFSQILMRKKELDPTIVSYIETINISGKNLLLLVNSILDFSKIDKGEMEFEPSSFYFHELLSEVNILIEPQLIEKQIHYSVFDNPELVVFADKQLLKQAFVNILANAAKFTPQHGKIELTHTLSNSKHLFCIHDNGPGIAPEDLDLLFEPFKQAQNAKNKLIQGTGLGLAITAKIIQELHGGKIWVHSDENSGTSFYIEL